MSFIVKLFRPHTTADKLFLNREEQDVTGMIFN